MNTYMIRCILVVIIVAASLIGLLEFIQWSVLERSVASYHMAIGPPAVHSIVMVDTANTCFFIPQQHGVCRLCAFQESH